jgi:AcrR family transcriptional regulator
MGTAERRDREKEARRESILAAARELFWERGFAATTMPLIAEAAELAPGTLYLYFPSKDALYVELLFECYDDLIERLRSAGASKRSPRSRAGALIDAFVGFARDCPQCLDIIFFVLQREMGSSRQAWLDAEQLRRLEAKEATCKKAAADILSGMTGKRRAATVEAVWSMLTGVVFFWRSGPADAFEEVSGEARRIILAALFE